MKIFPTKQDQPPPTPSWMKAGMVIFVVAMVISGYRGEQRAKEGDPTAVTIKKYEVLREFGDVDQWRRVINPSFARGIRYEELQEGVGDFAACGQRVKLLVVSYPYKPRKLTADMKPKKPIHFTVGDKKVLEAWDRGVRGMRKGAQRRIWAGARLVFPDIIDPDAQDVVFDLELQSLTPELGPNDKPLRYATVGVGTGVPASCGDKVAVRVRLLAPDDKAKEAAVLFETPEDKPVIFTLGDGTLGQGFDRGMVGMTVGEVRHLDIPSSYLPVRSDIPFAKYQNAVVEVMRVPYNDPDAAREETDAENTDKKAVKEPEHEPESDR